MFARFQSLIWCSSEPLKEKKKTTSDTEGREPEQDERHKHKSKYSPRMQYPMAQAFPQLKVISLYLLCFKGFFFINLGT